MILTNPADRKGSKPRKYVLRSKLNIFMLASTWFLCNFLQFGCRVWRKSQSENAQTGKSSPPE